MRFLPGLQLARALHPAPLALCYHVVSDADVDHTQHVYDYKTAAEFEADLDLLLRHYRPADVEAYASLTAPEFPPNSFVLTFDDGYREWFSVVAPILARKGIRGVFFVTEVALDNQELLQEHAAGILIGMLAAASELRRASMAGEVFQVLGSTGTTVEQAVAAIRAKANFEGRADLYRLMEAWGHPPARYLRESRPYLTSDEVRQLRAAGHVIGAHGIDHRCLHYVNREELAWQVQSSCRRIAQVTGQERVPFAFPYSCRVPEAVLREIREAFPLVGCFFGTGGLTRRGPGLQERIVSDWRLQSVRGKRPALDIVLANALYARTRQWLAS